MTKRKIIFLHIILFLVLTALLFFYSVRLLSFFAPGYHDVSMWLSLLFFGTFGILLITVVTCIIFIKLKTLFTNGTKVESIA